MLLPNTYIYCSCFKHFQNQLGIFSSKLTFDRDPLHDPLFGEWYPLYQIPTGQTGYPDIKGRMRERIDPLDMTLPPNFVRRRSIKLYNLPVNTTLLHWESSFKIGYQYVQ
jgi:hypothetical protein